MDKYGQKTGNISAITKTTVTVTLGDVTDSMNPSDKSNYTIKLGQTPVEVTAVAYNSTLKKAVLTVNLDNKEGKLTVNDTESSAFDFKAPQIATIMPISDKIIDVQFSEDVNAGLAQVISNYGLVETGTANVISLGSSTAVAKDTKTVRLTLPSALTKDKSYTLTVNNMQDVSTNKNTMTTGSSMAFTAIADTTKPTVISAIGKDANKVEITMSEEMNPLTAITASMKAYNTDGTLGAEILNTAGVAGVADSVKVSGNKVLITISPAHSASYLTSGQRYKVVLSAGGDLSNNVIADNQAADFTGVADNVAPTITADPVYDASTGKLTINFSEAMVGLGSTGNYTVFETNTGITAGLSVTGATASTDNTSVALAFSGLSANKQYSVRINGLTDASITPNNLAANSIVKFTIPAIVTPVQLSTASTASPANDGKSVKLFFNTNLVKAEAENIANYTIVKADDATKTLAVTKAVYDDTTQTVTLTTAAQEEGTANYKVTVAGLTNLKVDNNSATFNGIDKVAPTLVGITSINPTTFDLVFSEKVLANQSAATVSLVEKGTANVITANALGVTSGNGTKVRVTLSGADASHKLTSGKYYTITATGVKDISSAQNASTAASMDLLAIDDVTAPSITGVDVVSSGKIKVHFSEEIDSTAGTVDISNFVLKKGDTTVAWAGGATAVVDSTDKTSVIVDNGTQILEDGTNYTINVVDQLAKHVEDIATPANKVAQASYSFKGARDTVKPQLVSASVDPTADNKLVLKFSEAMSIPANTATAAANFTVSEVNTGINDVPTAAAQLDATDLSKVTLTLTSSTKAGVQYKVYVNNTNSGIMDTSLEQNLVDTNYAMATFTGIDIVAPSAAASKTLTNGNTIVLTFNEKIASTSVSADDFTVDGNTVTMASANSDDNTKVTLTLGTANTGLSNPTIKIAQGKSITDLTGNALTGGAGGTTLTGAFVDSAAPTLASATKIDKNTIKLEFSETIAAIVNPGTQAARDAILTVPGYTVSSITATGANQYVTVVVSSDITNGTNPTVSLSSTQTAITDGATNKYANGDIVVTTPGTALNLAATLVDALGASNDGKTQFDLPVASAVGNTFKYFVSTNGSAVTAPKLGDDLSSWTTVANNDTLTIANGTNIGIAEVDSNGKAVKFVNQTAVVTAYVAATAGTATGNTTYANIAAFNAALGDCSGTSKTLVLTIDGVDKTITFDANYSTTGFADWAAVKTFVEGAANLNGAATFTGVDAAGLKFTSPAGTSVTVKTDASILMGNAPVVVPGAPAAN